MTCPRCAIDLLKAAETAFDAGNIIAASQALLESSSEIADPGQARAILGERARMLAYGTRPNFVYWIGTLSRPQDAQTITDHTLTVNTVPCVPCIKASIDFQAAEVASAHATSQSPRSENFLHAG